MDEVWDVNVFTILTAVAKGEGETERRSERDCALVIG